MRGGSLIGVMDIDSPIPARFDEEDAAGLQKLCNTLMTYTDELPPLL